LRPGTSQSLRVSEIVGAGFRGSAVIRSAQPLAVMAQLESGGTSAAYTAEPYELGYVFNGIPFFSEGSQAAYCPLILDRGHGWDTGIIVQNLNKLVDAKVRVDLYSNAGEVLETRTGFIAPGSSARFDFPASANEIDQEPSASNWLQVISEEIWQEGTPQALSSNIAVVAHLVRGNDSGCVLESVLYNALSEGEAFNWPGVLNGAGTRHLLIPSFQKSFGEGQVSSVVSVVNVNPHQGSSTLSNVRFLGDGFTTNLSSISVPHRESFFLDSANLLGIPPGSAGVLAMSALPAGSGQVAGPGFAAMVLHRAEGLLPHLPCDATPPTSTPTDSPTETPSFTGTPTSPPTETPTGTPSLVSTETATITDTPSSTVTPTEALVVPTETPTFTSEGPTPTDTLGGPSPTASPSPTETLVGPSPTPTNMFEGPTPTATPTEDELHRADINRNGRVDEEDLLLLLKYWFQLVD
ncbi:MAG: hypothetical protein HUU16_17215, partial [Candidatus Omnitrophica bacterium]|nr:hypothetical protein [Candidatus Omnitrophota bacterium]